MLDRAPLITIAAAVATLVACGGEPRTGESSPASGADISPIGANGEARIFAADEDSSGTRYCFESSDLGLPAGTPVTVVHSDFPQSSAPGKLGVRSKSPCFPPPRASMDSMEYVVDAAGDTAGPSKPRSYQRTLVI